MHMRLTSKELEAIRKVLNEADPQGRIYLYGSRADDTRRGGDIDVYFETSRQLSLKAALTLEYRLASRCGTKVDLLIRNPGQADKPIHAIARKGVML